MLYFIENSQKTEILNIYKLYNRVESIQPMNSPYLDYQFSCIVFFISFFDIKVSIDRVFEEQHKNTKLQTTCLIFLLLTQLYLVCLLFCSRCPGAHWSIGPVSPWIKIFLCIWLEIHEGISTVIFYISKAEASC